MDAARDRLEVVDGERPRVEEAVPADDVERVVVEDVLLVAAPNAHLDEELAALASRVQLGGRVDVTVVVRGSLEDLSVLIPVAARDLDEPRRLEDEVALRPLGHEAVRRPARDDHVVAVLVGNIAEDGLERAASFVHEDDLVPLAVAEEVVHRALGAAERDLDVGVPHERASPGDLVALGGHVVGVLEPMRVRLGDPLLALDRSEGAELLHAAGRLEVVQDRLVAGEALEAHDLLGQEPSVLAKDDVALARELPATLVEGHVRPFRRWDSSSARRSVAAGGAFNAPRPRGRLYASGIDALGSVCQSPNSFPSGSLHTENQPMPGTGVASPASPPSSPTRAGPGVDVVDVEVRASATLGSVGAVDRAARVLREPRHPVSAGCARELLELPAEQRSPERLRLRRVTRGNLVVDHLTCHARSSRRRRRSPPLRLSAIQYDDEQAASISTLDGRDRGAMEPAGLEPATSCMPCKRSPN